MFKNENTKSGLMPATRFNFNIIGNFNKFVLVSIFMLIATIVLSFTQGVGIDIRFTGGSIITYSYTGEIDLDDIKNIAQENTGINVSVMESIDRNGNTNFILTASGTQNFTNEQYAELTRAFSEKYPDNNLERLNADSVEASEGREFFIKCIVALAFTFVVLVLFIGLRFRKIGGWSAGVMAIAGLLNDVVMVYLAFVIFRFPLDVNFIAVVLTILGYSLNDTIVVFDRLRENQDKFGSKISLPDRANLSINQTLNRTVNTSITTVTSMIVVCIVAFVFQVNSILSFAVPMVFGMIMGLYTSNFIVVSLWVRWRGRKTAK